MMKYNNSFIEIKSGIKQLPILIRNDSKRSQVKVLRNDIINICLLSGQHNLAPKFAVMAVIILGGDQMGKLRLRVRFDYEGKGKKGKFFSSRNSMEYAEELRQKKMNLMRNIPAQGIDIEEVEASQEVYDVFDEVEEKRVSFAPVAITFSADSLENAVRFIMKEEFRKVDFLEPDEISISGLELERLFMRINEEMLSYKAFLERKRDYWK